jgi:hypothetical protein
MTPYYPARDGYPSMLAFEENAGAVFRIQNRCVAADRECGDSSVQPPQEAFMLLRPR